MSYKNFFFWLKKNPSFMAWSGIFLMLLLSVLGIFSLTRLQTQYSVMQFLPSHHPALEMEKEVRERFHLSDLPVFVGLIELGKNESGTWFERQRISKLSDFAEKIKSLSAVSEVVSIASIESATDDHGIVKTGSLLEMTPENQWSSRILEDRLLTPNLISTDGRTILIYVQLQNADVGTLVQFESEFRTLLREKFHDSDVSVGGVPAVQTDLGVLLNKELKNFLGLTIFVCILTLLLIFKTSSTILIPLFLTAFSNIISLGIMAWMGLPFTVLSTTMPVLVFITVVSLTAHTLLKIDENFRDDLKNKRETSKWDLIFQSLREVFLPNFLGALTTCVGFLTLVLGKVPLIRDYGISIAMAVMLSWLLSSLGLIPFLLLLPRPQPRVWVRKRATWALWAIKRKKEIVLSVAFASLILIFMSQNLSWTGRLFDDLPENQEARLATEKIDASLGGAIPLEVMIDEQQAQAWSDPRHISELEHLIEELRLEPGVGSVHGVPDFLKIMWQHKNARLPATNTAISEIYSLYSLSNSNILSRYLTDDASAARVELKIHDLPSDQVQKLIARIHKKVAFYFPQAHITMGGMGSVVHLIHDELSTELIFGFWQALLLIVILLAFLFHSLRWALVAAFPNLIPPIALMGYLVLTKTSIKPGVAIIFSIALGLAFNNTVYLLNRMKAIAKKQRSPLFPVRRAFYLEGNPCLISTIIVMSGFSVFLFSYFSLNRTFGACMIVSIVAGMLGDLIFLPSLLAWFPKLLGTAFVTSESPVVLEGPWTELAGRDDAIDLDVGEI